MNTPQYTHHPGAKIIQISAAGQGSVYALTENGTVLSGRPDGYWTDITPVYHRANWPETPTESVEEKQS